MDVDLRGEGLCIRPFTERDIESFVEAVRESAATAGVWMPWCRADYSAAEAQDWFRTCANALRTGNAYELGIFAVDARTLYGGIALNQINRKHNFGSIGYWVRQSQQHRSIATRAVRLMKTFGFECLQLTRLEIIIPEENDASRKLAARVGAQFECIAKNRLLIRGEPVAAAVYSLLP